MTLPTPSGQHAGWQPIETAPRDGTQFLAAWNGDFDDLHVVGIRDGVCRREMDICEWSMPTHWMPLPLTRNSVPSPPAAEGEREAELVGAMEDEIKLLVCRCGTCNGTVAFETIECPQHAIIADKDDYRSIGRMVVRHALAGNRVALEFGQVEFPTCQCSIEQARAALAKHQQIT